MGFLETLRRDADPLYDGYYVSGRPGIIAGIMQAASGITITEDVAMKVSAFNNGVRILSETLGTLPLVTYRRLERGRSRATAHPLYNILHTKANPEMPSSEWRKMGMAHELLRGNFYSEIERTNASGASVDGGDIRALWPLNPLKMKVMRGRPETTGDTNKWYAYTRPDGTIKWLRDYQVLHIPGFMYDGLIGKSVLEYAADSLGLARATDLFASAFFANGATTSAVISHPGELGPEGVKGLQESIKGQVTGLSNFHRLLVLEESAKYEKIGIAPEEAQMLQTRLFQVEDLARFLNLPLHFLKDLEHATFSNIEHQGIEFVVYSLRPYLIGWEQWILLRLFNSSVDYFSEFLVDGLLRGDLKTRYEAYSIGKQNGWLNRDMICELENMNPTEGGDVFWMPSNMIPDTGAVAGAPSQKEKLEGQIGFASARVRDRYSFLFDQSIRRIISREIADLRHLEPDRFLGYYSGDSFGVFTKRVLGPVLHSCYETLREIAEPHKEGTKPTDGGMVAFIDDYLGGYTGRHADASGADISGALEEGVPPEKLFERWDTTRAIEETKAETASFVNAALEHVFKRIGRPELVVRITEA